MAFCPKCGEKMAEGMAFCTKCGERINSSVPSLPTNIATSLPKNSNVILPIFSLIFSIIGIILYVYFMLNFPNVLFGIWFLYVSRLMMVVGVLLPFISLYSQKSKLALIAGIIGLGFWIIPSITY